MSMDWSTFLLELVNFAILVWLLQRFLYRPVLKVIRQRRQAIEDEMAKAAHAREEAEASRVGLEREREEWERERERRNDLLSHEIEQARAQRMTELAAALEREREKARAVEAARQEALARQNESRAIVQGAQFCARLLQTLSGPEVQERLTRLFLEELGRLPADRVEEFRATLPADEELRPKVVSAFPLPAETRERVVLALRGMLRREVPVEFEQQADLVAGLHVQLGYWVLGANLRDELRFFADAANR
jgi:F-type H+-transporting ATPase subunit b